MKFFSPAKILFIIFLTLYAAISAYFAYGLQIYHNDAISRTALGFFTMFGRNPHLAAVGFVWQPLPSLAQIPFMLLLKPFNLMMLSGPLVTSIAGAVAVTGVYKIGTLLFKARKSLLPVVFAVLFGINPLIALYAAIGTSEMIFISSLVVSSYYLLKWFYSSKQQHLLLAGFFIALSFWCRYEALPAFGASIVLIIAKSLYDHVGLKKTESSVLQFLLPFMYSVFLWVLLNFMIMKDPFYFLNSPYSNPAFTAIFKSNPSFLENSYNSIMHSLQYMVKRSMLIAPVLGLLLVTPIALLVSKTKKLHDTVLLGFLSLPYIGILLFHVYQLYKGESFGWLRFFIYAIVGGSLIAMYFASKQKLLAVLSILLVLTGIVTTGYALSNHDLGREEESFVQKLENPSVELDYSRTYLDQKKIASVMDGLEGNVLIDTDKGFAIPMFAKDPKRFIITSDIDYKKIVMDYTHSDVQWIIIPKPAADDRGQNIIYTYYPGIWEGDAPKVSLYAEIDSWKILRVGDAVLPLTVLPVHAKSTETAKTSCTYTVQSGDSFWRISKRTGGKGSDYPSIMQLNATDSSLRMVLHPNQVLTIPCKAS